MSLVATQKKFYGLLVALAVAVVLISGCSALLANSGPLPIVCTQDTLILAWDADSNNLDESTSAIVYFKIFYRELGTLGWTYLQSTPDKNATVAIPRIGNGSYEFAVQSVFRNGRTSDFHGSSDFSASPPGGWYLKWE